MQDNQLLILNGFCLILQDVICMKTLAQNKGHVSYHEGKFKVVTVKGAFFHCQGQTMKDRNEYLEGKKETCRVCIMQVSKTSSSVKILVL